jgi:hypothetical protein
MRLKKCETKPVKVVTERETQTETLNGKTVLQNSHSESHPVGNGVLSKGSVTIRRGSFALGDIVISVKKGVRCVES